MRSYGQRPQVDFDGDDSSTPDVPFCAADKVVTAVVLARPSAPERERPAAPTTAATESGSACRSAGAGGLPRSGSPGALLPRDPVEPAMRNST